MADDPLSLVPQRTVIDGVPVYWSSSAGEPTITMMFRVGRVDELFAQIGITHVVEHLALNGVVGSRYPYNGAVGRDLTIFTATGSPAELVAFASSVCASLRSLPLDRLRRELNVLTVEAGGVPPNLPDLLLSHLCGYTAFGRGGLPELGLPRLRDTDVAAWASDRFTRDNVVVWIAGAPPAGLRLELPAGRRMAQLEPARSPTLQRSFVQGPAGVVALTALGPWGLALRAAAYAAGQRLSDKLRFEKGISYSTRGDAERLSAASAHMIVVADCHNLVQDDVAKVLLQIIGDIATTGRVAADLEPVLESLRRFSSAHIVRQTLSRWAFSELVGSEPRTVTEDLAALQCVHADEVAEALSAALKSSVLVLPPGCSVADASYPPERRAPAAAVAGRKFRRTTAARFNFGAQANYVALGETGVSHVDERGGVTTVLFESCAGLLKLSADRRLLLGEDRQQLELKGADWRDGRELIALVDLAIPDDRTAWMRVE